MGALYYIVDTLVGLYRSCCCCACSCNGTRADFRNPVARAILQVTNPVSAAAARAAADRQRRHGLCGRAILVVATSHSCGCCNCCSVMGCRGCCNGCALVLVAARDWCCTTYLYSIFLHAVLSFVAPGNYSPAQSILRIRPATAL